MPIRLVLADDHAMIRSALRMFLSLDPDLEVVGEAGDGNEAVRQVEKLRPDLVLMDLHMPGGSGLEAIAQIRSRFPETEVLALTSGTSQDELMEALNAGARGYILKDTHAGQLIRTLKAALASRAHKVAESKAAPVAEVDLTERESEVMKLVAQGLSNQQIAQRLEIAEGTVKTHVSALLGKLGLRTRAQIAVHSWKTS